MQDDDLPQSLMQALLLPLIDELSPIVGHDKDAAWEAAEAATMSLNPQSVLEFRLAVRVALFNILANRLTFEANATSLTPACSIRMRQCALSYAREADKAERRLEKKQAARMEVAEPEPKAPPAEPTPVAATEEPVSQAPKAEAVVPAYKRLKQERRLAKQSAKDARLKAQAEAQARAPGLPTAA